MDVKELQTKLDIISDQYNAGHNLLRATYDDEHVLPFGRLQKMIADELNSGGYRVDQLYIMLKADAYSSLANVLSQAIQAPVVEFNTDFDNWEELLYHQGLGIITELFEKLDSLAKGYNFMLYVPGFSAFNELGKFHYNAKSDKLGGISDGTVEAIKATVAYSHSLTICLPHPNSSDFYNALGNKQYKPLIKKFNAKFQQHSLTHYGKEHMALLNKWLETGVIPEGMQTPELLQKDSETYRKKKEELIQKIKKTYNSVGEDGRYTAVIEPSLSDLDYNLPDVVETAIEALDKSSVQVLDCYQIVRACNTPGHQTKRVIRSQFQKDHTALFIVKNWESLERHPKIREEIMNLIDADNWCRVIFDLDEFDLVHFSKLEID